MARPQALPDDLATVQRAGVDTVLSLLERSEAAQIGLSFEATTCDALGLAFLTHPIRDMHLPDPTAFAACVTDVAARLRSGAHIAVHCYASIGRSGMLTCAVLGHFGYTPANALALVSKMRGTPVPDTPQQTRFIHRIMARQRP